LQGRRMRRGGSRLIDAVNALGLTHGAAPQAA
jgi:hypothetical protein